MKDIAPHDRPREKLARAGVASLGDNELVALVLGSGVRARSALTVAQEVLDLAGGVRGLLRADGKELQRVAGVGASRGARLVAAIELGRRASGGEFGDRPVFRGASTAGPYLLRLYGGHSVERFGVMLLDAKCRLIRSEIVSVGTVDSSIAHPREIFRSATLASAAQIIVFHNHPSGDPMPSPDDVDLTERLKSAGEVMGIAVVDHIVLGDNSWFSFGDMGKL